MKKVIITAVAACALAFAGVAAAALEPGVYDPTNGGCPVATYSHGVLHLAKNCATTTGVAAGAEITGFAGQTFSSASFTLASASQCLGGSPRFLIYTSTSPNPFQLGCNNVTPTTNPDGSATYTFSAATLPAASVPTGPLTYVGLVLDVQGAADLTNITVNGVRQTVAKGQASAKTACKNGGYKTMTNPTFKNQGQCIAHYNHVVRMAKQAAKTNQAKAKSNDH
jgi:hypothetical protein